LGALFVRECANKSRAEGGDDATFREHSRVTVDLKPVDTVDGSNIGATIDQIELVIKEAIAKKK